MFEIAEEEVLLHAPRIQARMERVVPEAESRGIPFTAEGKVGPTWGAMEALAL